MPRKTDHDIGFDAQGNPFAVGDEASAGADAIVDDPRATPILIVAARDNAIGVRVFGALRQDGRCARPHCAHLPAGPRGRHRAAPVSFDGDRTFQPTSVRRRLQPVWPRTGKASGATKV